MDDKKDIRTDRLRAWCRRNAYFDPVTERWRVVEIGARLKMSPAQISDYLKGNRKSFGPSVARKIEAAAGMSMWYLDGGSTWPFSAVLHHRVETLSDEELEHLENAIRAHLKMPTTIAA